MLSPKEFVARWGEALMRFPNQALESLSLSEEDKDFLAQAGLPRDAAPFLTFEVPKSGQIPTVAEEWNQPKLFAVYRAIGFDGDDELICRVPWPAGPRKNPRNP